MKKKYFQKVENILFGKIFSNRRRGSFGSFGVTICCTKNFDSSRKRPMRIRSPSRVSLFW